MADARFPRAERLKSRTSIGLLFSRSSKSVAESGLRLIWCPSTEPLERGAQVLVAAPKKRFKRAVVRNRIKRLLREAWRMERGSLTEEWVASNSPKLIGLVYTGDSEPSLTVIRSTLRVLLDRANW